MARGGTEGPVATGTPRRCPKFSRLLFLGLGRFSLANKQAGVAILVVEAKAVSFPGGGRCGSREVRGGIDSNGVWSTARGESAPGFDQGGRCSGPRSSGCVSPRTLSD